MKEKDLKFLQTYLKIKEEAGAISATHVADIVDMCRINCGEDEDAYTIEKWQMKELLNTFRMLVNTFPKIPNRTSCLDRNIMAAYYILADIVNGEHTINVRDKVGAVPNVKL